MTPWTDPAWRAEADGWIHEQLLELGTPALGDLDQVHIRPWSTVIRVATETGSVYFKANTPALAHEAAVTMLVSERRPDCVPPLLRVDLDRGWMLMSDGGTALRELIAAERELEPWLDALSLYASVQVDLTADVDELLALGAPDLRLPALPHAYEAMLDDLGALPVDERRRLQNAVPVVAEMCEELGGYGIPATIQHDDLHDGHVYVQNGRTLLLDWGDTCVSHPFFTMAVTLDGVIAWGLDDVEGSVDTAPYRDAYLEPFAGVTGPVDLVVACTMARRLGWICRAVNGHLGGSEVAQSRTRLRMFLDGRP